jgi:hypothetical protein
VSEARYGQVVQVRNRKVIGVESELQVDGTHCGIPLSMPVNISYTSVSPSPLVLLQLSSITHPFFLRRM